MTLVLETVEDLDAAILRICEAESERLQQRSLREALGHLYTLREHRVSQQNLMRRKHDPTAEKYVDLAKGDSDGRVAEGVVFMRGQLVHQVTKTVGVKLTDVFINRFTNLVGALAWLHLDEMGVKLPVGDQLECYRTYVMGRPVLDTLDVARKFLVESPDLGAL